MEIYETLRHTPDQHTDHNELQIGKRYPDGTTVWADEFDLQSKYSSWRTEKGRGEAQDAYRQQLQGVGIIPTEETRLTFVYRTKDVTFSAAIVIAEKK